MYQGFPVASHHWQTSDRMTPIIMSRTCKAVGRIEHRGYSPLVPNDGYRLYACLSDLKQLSSERRRKANLDVDSKNEVYFIPASL